MQQLQNPHAQQPLLPNRDENAPRIARDDMIGFGSPLLGFLCFIVLLFAYYVCKSSFGELRVIEWVEQHVITNLVCIFLVTYAVFSLSRVGAQYLVKRMKPDDERVMFDSGKYINELVDCLVNLSLDAAGFVSLAVWGFSCVVASEKAIDYKYELQTFALTLIGVYQIQLVMNKNTVGHIMHHVATLVSVVILIDLTDDPIEYQLTMAYYIYVVFEAFIWVSLISRAYWQMSIERLAPAERGFRDSSEYQRAVFWAYVNVITQILSIIIREIYSQYFVAKHFDDLDTAFKLGWYFGDLLWLSEQLYCLDRSFWYIRKLMMSKHGADWRISSLEKYTLGGFFKIAAPFGYLWSLGSEKYQRERVEGWRQDYWNTREPEPEVEPEVRMDDPLPAN